MTLRECGRTYRDTSVEVIVTATHALSLSSGLTLIVHVLVLPSSRFGKMVDKVVPFLPLSKPQLRTILDLKLHEKSAARRYL